MGDTFTLVSQVPLDISRSKRRAVDDRYYKKHKEEIIARGIRYRKLNPDKVRERKARYYKLNIDKVRAYNKASYKRRKKYIHIKRFERRLKGYGITAYDIIVMLIIQKGLCAACLKPFSSEEIHIDHNHVSGVVRGLVHERCNLAMGSLNEDPDTIYNVYMYVSKYHHLLPPHVSDQLNKEVPYGIKEL